MSDPYSLQAGSFSRNHVLPIYSPTEYPERYIWVCHPPASPRGATGSGIKSKELYVTVRDVIRAKIILLANEKPLQWRNRVPTGYGASYCHQQVV